MWTRRVICKNVLQRCFSSGKQSKGEKTALYDFHVEKGGKIVNFGGFLLPVQYSDLSITASHIHTRTKASIFDVSHMLQTEVKGNHSLEYLESICTADLKNLQNNSSVLTIFTNEKGGIYDDLIITKIANDHLYIVSNAAMKEQDQQILTTALQNYKTRNSNCNIDLKFFSPLEKGLLALQGPKAAENLQKLTDVDLQKLYFMTSTIGRVGNVENCRITRCGYTGEDGFEISMPAERQREVAETLLRDENVKMAGLGARDTLRLEAGLCLYGSDMDQSTTPVEAALTWLVSKSRREKQNFPGAQTIIDQIKNGCLRKRVGIISEAGPPARYGTKIVNENNEQIGDITSGCPAPTLGKNISMGYIQTENSKIGTKISLRIRDKLYNGVVTKMPFVVSHYYNKPKTTL
ncbi:hypothetical protein WA026_011885 [Henosepilachna vigintioctopunctata]|uniref:Aminomethyltransferase n=1 Tax=Henosepilachna vigintioctopunctata TaxID=420089 RepID=A0AAW1UAH9_9CUCU